MGNRKIKYCSYCGEEKEIKFFNTNKGRGDGLYVYCKECSSIRSKLIYLKTKKSKPCVICGKEYIGFKNSKRCINCRFFKEKKEIDGYRQCLYCGFSFPFRVTLKVRGYGRIRNGGIGSIKQKFCSLRCALIFRNKSLENRLKVGKSHKGKKHQGGWKLSESHKDKMSLVQRGEKNSNWNGGSSPLDKLIRNNRIYEQWRESVFKRDNYICQKYLIRGGRLIAHHINNFADFPELRTSIENGITLSKEAHKEFHHIYGNKKTTKEQMTEFLKGCEEDKNMLAVHWKTTVVKRGLGLPKL